MNSKLISKNKLRNISGQATTEYIILATISIGLLALFTVFEGEALEIFNQETLLVLKSIQLPF